MRPQGGFILREMSSRELCFDEHESGIAAAGGKLAAVQATFAFRPLKMCVSEKDITQRRGHRLNRPNADSPERNAHTRQQKARPVQNSEQDMKDASSHAQLTMPPTRPCLLAAAQKVLHRVTYSSMSSTAAPSLN